MGVRLRPATPEQEAIADHHRNRVSTPCQQDFEITRSDWTAKASSRYTRRDIKVRAAQCRWECPIRKDCERLGDSEGRNANGIYGGFYYDTGWKVDPFDHHGKRRRSVYRRVHWDTTRGRWKAEAQIEGERTHIGYFDDEDVAATAVEAWEERNENDCGTD